MRVVAGRVLEQRDVAGATEQGELLGRADAIERRVGEAQLLAPARGGLLELELGEQVHAGVDEHEAGGDVGRQHDLDARVVDLHASLLELGSLAARQPREVEREREGLGLQLLELDRQRAGARVPAPARAQARVAGREHPLIEEPIEAAPARLADRPLQVGGLDQPERVALGI